jgi:hypothetical protein
MDMILEGSCQCGRVSFTVDSETVYPFMYCYCSICRKLSGGPFGCNIMGKRQTLRVRGKAHLRVYHAVVREKGKRAVRSPAERTFCGECGTHLYLLDDRWPEGVWPNAGAIDTPLPRPPEHVQIMTENKPAWVPHIEDGPSFKRYPKLSIADWHAQHGLVGKVQNARQRR